ncbi:hypothetical protein FQA39_LY03740 [Lamprigera yunnana]|nr:hypothetical protein FQA39_LY03740 [Lamprigera yunnana]
MSENTWKKSGQTCTVIKKEEKRGLRERKEDDLNGGVSELLPYLQDSQQAPPTHETQEEKIEIPENDAEVNNVRKIDREDTTITDEEAESHANTECNESAAVAEEVEIPEVDETSEEENEIPVNDAELAEEEEENHDNPKYDKLEAEIPANDAGAEVDVGREEILTDKEVEHNTNPEGDEVLKKVKEEIVRKETLESVTERKDLEPLDHAVPVVLGNLYTHKGEQCL